MVTYRNESTIAVRPASEAELAHVLAGPDDAGSGRS
jgi:hypothetical protein